MTKNETFYTKSPNIDSIDVVDPLLMLCVSMTNIYTYSCYLSEDSRKTKRTEEDGTMYGKNCLKLNIITSRSSHVGKLSSLLVPASSSDRQTPSWCQGCISLGFPGTPTMYQHPKWCLQSNQESQCHSQWKPYNEQN